MALINLEALDVTLGAPLFSNLNLAIGPGDRLGLVAANGRGKSTLLRCIAGGFDATAGKITRARGLRVGHVEQDVPTGLLGVHSSLTSSAARCPAEQRRRPEAWRVDVALDSLEVPSTLRERPLSQLSMGWQRLAMLARVWGPSPICCFSTSRPITSTSPGSASSKIG